MTFAFITQAIAARKAEGLLRVRKLVSQNIDGVITVDGKACLNFASNDYLGLSQHPDVLQTYVEGLAEFGAGSTASAAVCGYMTPHFELEEKLCELFNKEAVMLFNSGFAANQSICQALFSSTRLASGNTHNSASTLNSNILCDKRMHASFVEGAMHCNAKFRRYKHNNIEHFSKQLKQCDGNTLVATEGVFSMDGDFGNIADMQAVLKHHNHMLLIDDAHGFGVIGSNGLGVCELPNINTHHIDILMATFGKAIGTAGAFVAGSRDLIDYLVNFAKHYVYSTAIPPAQALATIKSIDIMQHGPQREKLHNNISLFTQLTALNGLSIQPSDSAIMPLIIGDSETCLAASDALLAMGIFVPAIRTPTVAKQTERLRITLSAVHNEQDIRALVDALCVVRQRQAWQS